MLKDQLDGLAISTAADLEKFMLEIKQGDEISIVFIRGNSVITAEVTV
jgi:hypothetical protein